MSGTGPLTRFPSRSNTNSVIRLPSDLRARCVRRARLGNERMVHLLRRETAAAERRRLNERDVHRSRGERPVVGREVHHAFVRTVPAVVAAGDDPGETVHPGPVLDLPVRIVGGSPRPAEGIAQAGREDEVGGRQAVGRVEEGIVGRGGAIEIDAQNLPAHGPEILRRGGPKAVADVNVELAVGAYRQVRDLVGGAQWARSGTPGSSSDSTPWRRRRRCEAARPSESGRRSPAEPRTPGSRRRRPTRARPRSPSGPSRRTRGTRRSD